MSPGVRRYGPWALVAAVLVLFGVAAAAPTHNGALDPNGTGPNGAKALVLLLQRYGADLTLDQGVPGPGIRTALILRDQLDSRRRDALMAWVHDGGTLVVSDPTSHLETGTATDVSSGLAMGDNHPTGSCLPVGLTDELRLDVGASLFLRPVGAATACYEASSGDGGTAAFLVAVPAGRGRVIGLGGAGQWINARLARVDNAAFALDLLAPRAGTAVDLLTASPAGSGRTSLLGLLNPRLKTALIELLVAFGLLAWWKGRRLGRPVADPVPVRIPGSEIVVAVGDLLARTHNRDAAGHQLRDATRRFLGERLGLGPHAGTDEVAAAGAGRAGWSGERIRGVLGHVPLSDDTELVELAAELARLRQEVAHEPAG